MLDSIMCIEFEKSHNHSIFRGPCQTVSKTDEKKITSSFKRADCSNDLT